MGQEPVNAPASKASSTAPTNRVQNPSQTSGRDTPQNPIVRTQADAMSSNTLSSAHYRRSTATPLPTSSTSRPTLHEDRHP